MVTIVSLWLPILLSAVAVFVVSSLLHMVLRYHQNDFRRLPQEEAVLEALHKFSIPPGEYALPWCGSMAAMKDPAVQKKMADGPVGFFTVFPNGQPGMGAPLVQWFIYSLVVGIFAAYLTGHALQPGASYAEVLRFASCTAFLGYSLALVQVSIWYRRQWSTSIKNLIDGLIYGLVTGAIFGWLWPH
jgi:Flp pilus assembly protein TadB